MLTMTYEYKLEPNPYEPFPNYHKQAKQLTIVKKTNSRLKSVHSQVLQQTLRTLDRAKVKRMNRVA